MAIQCDVPVQLQYQSSTSAAPEHYRCTSVQHLCSDDAAPNEAGQYRCSTCAVPVQYRCNTSAVPVQQRTCAASARHHYRTSTSSGTPLQYQYSDAVPVQYQQSAGTWRPKCHAPSQLSSSQASPQSETIAARALHKIGSSTEANTNTPRTQAPLLATRKGTRTGRGSKCAAGWWAGPAPSTTPMREHVREGVCRASTLALTGSSVRCKDRTKCRSR